MITVNQAMNRKRRNMYGVILGCAAFNYASNRRRLKNEWEAIQVKLNMVDISNETADVLMDELDTIEFYQEHYQNKHGYSMYPGIRGDVAQALGTNMDPAFHAVFNWVMENHKV